MDRSAEKYLWPSLLLGFVLALVWGAMCLAHAYQRGLTKVNDSFIQGLMIVDQLGVIVNALGRLSVDEEAFLSTGDSRFQDGVVESAETFVLDMDALNLLAARSKLQQPLLDGLSRSIYQVLDSVAESDKIRDTRGAAAAVTFFESKEAAIADAKAQAERLRMEITGGISEGIRGASGASAMFQALLYGVPVQTGLVHKEGRVTLNTAGGIL